MMSSEMPVDVGAHQEDPDRKHQRRQDHRPGGVEQPDLAQEQEERDDQRRLRDHHRAEHQRVERPLAEEVVLGEGVARERRHQRRADRREGGVVEAVPQPAAEDAVAVGEEVVQVLEQVEVAREPEPEGGEEVRVGLGRRGDEVEERREGIDEIDAGARPSAAAGCAGSSPSPRVLPTIATSGSAGWSRA